MIIKSKVAVITGGVRGLGAAAAIRLAASGATVIITDIDPLMKPSAPGLAQAISAYHRLDVCSREQWQAVLGEIVSKEGSLDILHLNAGLVTRPVGADMFDDPLKWLNSEAARRVISVNIEGVVNGIVAGLPYLEKSRGTIILTASLAGVRAFAADPLYAMSKHAVVGLARSLGPSLEKLGISINAICPGGIDTRMVPPQLRRTAPLSSPAHVAQVICGIIERGGTGGIWLVPADGTVRIFDVDPLVHTAQQAAAQSRLLES